MNGPLLVELVEKTEDGLADLVFSKAVSLDDGNIPTHSGVFSLFCEEERVYFGQATGSQDLKNRARNNLSDDQRHTCQKQFLSQYPEKATRRAHIEENMKFAFFVEPSSDMTKAIERALILINRPIWNKD